MGNYEVTPEPARLGLFTGGDKPIEDVLKFAKPLPVVSKPGKSKKIKKNRQREKNRRRMNKR